MRRAKVLVNEFGKMEKATSGRPRYSKKNGQTGRSLDSVQKMLGPCETENGTKIDELLQAGASGYKRVRQNVKTHSDARRRQGSCQRSLKKNWKIEGHKERIIGKEHRRLSK